MESQAHGIIGKTSTFIIQSQIQRKSHPYKAYPINYPKRLSCYTQQFGRITKLPCYV